MNTNQMILTTNNLPERFEDVAAFAVIAQEKLKSVRAEISAIKRLGLAQEVLKQKTTEAQELAEVKLRAEMKLGELTRAMPKNQGVRTDLTSAPQVQKLETKADALERVNIPHQRASQYEVMAAHPEIVEQAIAEARANDDIASRSDILKRVKEQKEETERICNATNQIHKEETNDVHRPHVTNNSGCNEWYTPKKYIDLVKQVLGEIDLDPASCEYANNTVQAKRYYTIEEDGLSQTWNGKVWMNPPYQADLVQKFASKFISEYTFGNIVEGIVLVNNATETGWFSCLIKEAKAISFPQGRIRYESDNRQSLAPLQGQAFLYFGNEANEFLKVFSEIGWGAIVYHG